MTRFVFGLAVLAVWTNPGFAQTKEIQDQIDKQLKDLRTEDELLRQALASHPDVLVAQAKRQVAEAELAQVKLVVAQKLSKLKSELFIEENALITARKKLDRLLELRKKGTVNEQEVLDAELKVQLAQANLSHITTELQEVLPNPKSPSSQHPDVLVATAKLQVAEAELAQTKLAISQKIAKLKAEIEAQKQTLQVHETLYNELRKASQTGTASRAELIPAQIRFLESRTALSRLNSEFKGMTDVTHGPAVMAPAVRQFVGNGNQGFGDSVHIPGFLGTTSFAANRPAGSVAEKLSAVIDQKVKFEAKAQLASAIIKSLVEKYGLDVTIRMPLLEKEGGFPLERMTLSLVPGEMNFTSWMELIVDELNSKFNDSDLKTVTYIREYGLLITAEKLVPKDAMTLKEFARQVRAEKEREKAAAETKKP